MTAAEAANLTELMRDVVVEGTGSAVRTDAYTVAAKTGTAEFETGKETHAWFTGFAPVESPKIVVTVLVEESGSGGKVAGPIARQLFDIYMSENHNAGDSFVNGPRKTNATFGVACFSSDSLYLKKE